MLTVGVDVPETTEYVPVNVADDDQYCIVPTYPVKLIVGGVLPLHIVSVPAVIVAVPATVVGSTTTVATDVTTDGHTPLVIFAL